MSTPKGYSSQEKDLRLSAQFVTVEPVRTKQFAESVISHQFVREIASDAVEANSTTTSIVATAHAAKKGDVIRFTSGSLSGQEVKVISTTANAIDLAETLASAPNAADGFDILRHVYPKADADGVIATSAVMTQSPIQFVLDGVDTEVTEDTVTPANNAPLPVKITSASGDINITAGDLNVQLSHAGVSYDSTRVGDGTDLLEISAAGEALVKVNSALPAGTNNIGDVDVLSQPARSHSTDSIKIGDGTDFLSISAAGAASVELASAIPAGNNNIGDIDVASLPGTVEQDIADIKAAVEIIDNAISGSEMQVDVVTQPARSHSSDSIKIGDGTDFLSISGSGEALVAVNSALPAGNNNIGDVDVASLPSIPAGSNLIGLVDVNLDVVDFIDTTQVLDTSSTNITASSGNPVQIVSTLAANVKKIRVNDTTGKFIGVYTGAALSEVLQCVVGPGMDGDIEVKMNSGERVSLRHMSNSAIASGEICIQFYG